MFTRRIAQQATNKGSQLIHHHPRPQVPSGLGSQPKPVPIQTAAKRQFYTPRPINIKLLHPRDLPIASEIEAYYGRKSLSDVVNVQKKVRKAADKRQGHALLQYHLPKDGKSPHIPLTRALYPNTSSPDVIANEGWATSWLTRDYLRLDYGVNWRTVMFPWYLIRSVRPSSSITASKPQAFSIMDTYHGIAANGAGPRFVRRVYIGVAMCIPLDIWLFYQITKLKMKAEKRQRARLEMTGELEESPQGEGEFKEQQQQQQQQLDQQQQLSSSNNTDQQQQTAATSQPLVAQKRTMRV